MDKRGDARGIGLQKKRQKILAAMDASWTSTGDIAEAAKMDVKIVSNALVGMANRKLVELKSVPRPGKCGTHKRVWRKPFPPENEFTEQLEAKVRAALSEMDRDGLLGMLPDEQLAKAYGIPESRIRSRRITLEIKPFAHAERARLSDAT